MFLRRTAGRPDGRTDTTEYRDARTHLKTVGGSSIELSQIPFCKYVWPKWVHFFTPQRFWEKDQKSKVFVPKNSFMICFDWSSRAGSAPKGDYRGYKKGEREVRDDKTTIGELE